MSAKHPYVASGGPLLKVVEQFKRAFPPTVNAETLKKLGAAPENESYVINILRFIGCIDDQGRRTADAASAFTKHDSAEFQTAFAEMVGKAYSALFELHGDVAWKLDLDKLIAFFRANDHTTDIVGKRQASTFQTLALIAGKIEKRQSVPKSDTMKASKANEGKKSREATAPPMNTPAADAPGTTEIRVGSGVGLTVRIEINLPAQGDQDTYNMIFRSIRENLLDGR